MTASVSLPLCVFAFMLGHSISIFAALTSTIMRRALHVLHKCKYPSPRGTNISYRYLFFTLRCYCRVDQPKKALEENVAFHLNFTRASQCQKCFLLSLAREGTKRIAKEAIVCK